MWWRLLPVGLLATGIQAFTPASIFWGGLPAKKLLLAPRAFPNRFSFPSFVPPQQLTILEQSGRRSPKEIPHFTANSDNTITWDATGWCVEAHGDDVRVNKCTGAPSQQWEFAPSGSEGKSQIQLKDTHKCLDVSMDTYDKNAGLNVARVELRECDGKATESWNFEKPLQLPTQESSRPTLAPPARRLGMTAVASAALLALSLIAWVWRWRKKLGPSAMSQGGPLTVDQKGLCMSVPLATNQRNSALAVMVIDPQQTQTPPPSTSASSFDDGSFEHVREHDHDVHDEIEAMRRETSIINEEPEPKKEKEATSSYGIQEKEMGKSFYDRGIRPDTKELDTKDDEISHKAPLVDGAIWKQHGKTFRYVNAEEAFARGGSLISTIKYAFKKPQEQLEQVDIKNDEDNEEFGYTRVPLWSVAGVASHDCGLVVTKVRSAGGKNDPSISPGDIIKAVSLPPAERRIKPRWSPDFEMVLIDGKCVSDFNAALEANRRAYGKSGTVLLQIGRAEENSAAAVQEPPNGGFDLPIRRGWWRRVVDLPTEVFTCRGGECFIRDPCDLRSEAGFCKARYTSSCWMQNLRKTFKSPVMKRIRQPLLVNVFWALVVATLHRFSGWPRLAFPKVHGLIGSALGLLLVFRTNAAYERFWEGCRLWEKLLGDCRALARLSMLYRSEMTKETAKRVTNLICVYAIVLAKHLGQDTYDYKRLLTPEDVASLHSAQNQPLWVSNTLSREIRMISDQSEGNQALFSARERLTMISQVEKMTKCLGACERLVHSPVPLNYPHHTGRVLATWTLTMPFALVGQVGFGIVPIMALLSWALFGIQEIGLMIEDPFADRKTLDLGRLVGTICKDVKETMEDETYN